jgi:hypothetical protein
MWAAHFLHRRCLPACLLTHPPTHLEAAAALRQVGVSVDPVQAVHVHRHPAGPGQAGGRPAPVRFTGAGSWRQRQP